MKLKQKSPRLSIQKLRAKSTRRSLVLQQVDDDDKDNCEDIIDMTTEFDDGGDIIIVDASMDSSKDAIIHLNEDNAAAIIDCASPDRNSDDTPDASSDVNDDDTLTIIDCDIGNEKRNVFDLKLHFKASLLQEGLESYLKSVLGGQKSSQEISTIGGRVADYLLYSCNFLPQDDNVLDFLGQALLAQHPEYLVNYCSTLEQSYKPATISHYLETFKSVARWLGDIKRPNLKKNVKNFIALAKIVKRPYSKRARMATKAAKTIEVAIHTKHIPKSGLHGIQSNIIQHVGELNEEIFKLPDVRNAYSNDKFKYDFFMGMLFASLYAFSPQGRIGGITVALYSQVKELIDDGHTLVEHFKTNTTYIFQPVTSSNTSRILIGLYIGHIRPSVFRKPYDPLWLNYNGDKMSSHDISLLVRLFFEKTMNIRLTSTSIRSLVETEMDKLLQSRKITEQQRDAVHKINGHTSQIANTYYVMKERQQNSTDSCAAFAKLYDEFAYEPLDEFDALNSLVEEVVYPDRPVVQAWGSEHPQGHIIKAPPGSTGKIVKYQWSPAEISYLKMWIKSQQGNNKLCYSRCLAHIYKDLTATSIFHEHHITTSARLKSGYDRAEKELNSNPEE